MIKIRVDTTKLEARTELWGEVAELVLSREMQEAVAGAVQYGALFARLNHPYKDRTGRLTNSTRGFIVSTDQHGTEGAIEADAEHASHVEYGTRPHVIVPTTASVLRWVDDESGEEHFATRVHHPGTEPLPFIQPAADEAGIFITERLEARLPDALDAVFRSRR